MDRLEIYDRVNRCETYEELAEVLESLEDDMGYIEGRSRSFRAKEMIHATENFGMFMSEGMPNVLTREFGIRQQAMYIYYYSQ